MKGLVLGACVLILALFSSAQLKPLKDAREIRMQDSTRSCMTERNMTGYDDMYRPEEIISNLYAEPGNEERRNKNGCFIICVLKKQNLMEGSSIKEEDTLTKLDELFDDPDSVRNIARECLKDAKSLTQECEKGFFLYECIVKRTFEQRKNHEKYGKQETEENAETTQAE